MSIGFLSVEVSEENEHGAGFTKVTSAVSGWYGEAACPA
jgi:hypothetical protein